MTSIWSHLRLYPTLNQYHTTISLWGNTKLVTVLHSRWQDNSKSKWLDSLSSCLPAETLFLLFSLESQSLQHFSAPTRDGSYLLQRQGEDKVWSSGTSLQLCPRPAGSPISSKQKEDFLEEEDVNIGSCEVLVNAKYKVNEKVAR